MLTRSNLRTQILWGYSLPIVCLAGLGTAIYFNAQFAFQRQADARLAETTITKVDEALLGASQVVRNARGYIIFPGDPSYIKSFEEGLTTFQSAYDVLDEQVKNPKRRAELAQLQSEVTQLEAGTRRVFALVDAGRLGEAKQEVQNLRMSKMDDLRVTILKEEQVILDSQLKESNDAQNLLVLLALVGTLTSIAFTVIIGLLISRQISNKINAAVGVAQQISEGDLTHRITGSEDKESKNEVNQLLAAFQAMTNYLNLLIRQVQQSGIQVTTSSTQIAASGKQLEATVAEQVASTHEVVATAKEITATSSELARTMEEVAAMAQITTTAASSSQDKLSHMEAMMRLLAEATGSISAKLEMINEKANNISSIVTTITKVADQTNLLSLNAAIEAEKAGEYGSGFSVVAREIRRLADQTAVATLDIEQMVKEMLSAVATGVMEMDKFTVEVGRGVANVQTVGTELTDVIERVQALTPRYALVSQGMDAQSQGAHQIMEAMVQLSETSGQTADALREINQAIGQLNDAAQDLRQEISRFKVS